MILEDIKKDLTSALKEKDALRVETLRIILAEIHNAEIAKGKDKELGEKDISAVVSKEAKKRREASEVYRKAGRDELADKEDKELEVIKTYLPPEMGGEEIEALVKEVVSSGEANFGKVMGQVMSKVTGRAEPGKVSEVVKKTLEAKTAEGGSPDASASRGR